MDLFLEISVVLAIAAVMALAMQWLRQPLVLGHLLTGVLVGPLVLHLIRSRDTIELFSSMGIAALLFIIGLSLSPSVLREVGKVSLLAGIGQVVFTTLLGFLILRALGFAPLISFYIGLALTFSSTIIVTKILADKKTLTRLHGKIAVGILLVQDLVAMLILIVASSFGKGLTVADVLAASVVKGVLIVGILTVFSLTLLPAIAKFFARSQEFLFLFSVGWGFGLAAVFQALGLSMEVGALAAGVSLAASPYRHEIGAKMKTLRDFFITLFFISLGAQLSFVGARELLYPTVVLSLFVLVGNPLVVMLLLGALGYNKKVGFLTALTMAQVSEFSLILVVIGIRAGELPQSALNLVTFVATLSISLSTILLLNGERLFVILSPFLGWLERRMAKKDTGKREAYEILLFGCNRVGEDFLSSLKRTRKQYLVVDFDPAVIAKLTQEGIPCRYGDADDEEFLDTFDFAKTKMIVSTVPDSEATIAVLKRARKKNPSLVFIAVAQSTNDAVRLYELGASYVILPHFIGGNYASLLFEKYGLNPAPFAKEGKKHLEHLVKKMGQKPA